MGVDAEMTGRNDIQVGQIKFQGIPWLKLKDRMFSHGTLMLNSDLGEITKCIES